MKHSSEESFQIKADLVPLTVFKLNRLDLAVIENQLKNTLKKAPNYFAHAPVLIDVTDLAEQEHLDLNGLQQLFREHRLISVALRGANPNLADQAHKAGLALFNNSTKNSFKTEKPDTKEPKSISTNPNKTATKLITKPVRAGTQIYAKGGDLIILAAVNPGAECLADGNIHVYGPLRGKALAGISGDKDARIFCRSLEAELIAIAGHYQIKEHLKFSSKLNEGMIQIYLEHEKIQITSV
jgi:septum site-determining protein MinC